MPHSTSGLLLLSCIAVISHAVLRAGANYSNPIVQQDGFDLGDPGALFYDGFYYLATSSGDRQNAFPIRRSHASSHTKSWATCFQTGMPPDK